MNFKIDLEKADWSTAYVNDLPDSAFLYIQSGGEKDSEGKTKPRTLRHFPYKDSTGKVDLIHVRNAIARIPQSTFGLSAEQMKALQNKARKYLKGNKTMTKGLTIDLEKAKYKKRIPKAGGGYISIGDNDMPYRELNDFLKSTIEDEKQPTIGTGKEQGAAMGMGGKGENKGTPGTGSSSPEVGNPPKAKVDKLSEDDEVDEKAVSPHKKPIEKSIPLNTWNQTEYMQREHRMYRDACENSDGDIDFSKSVSNKSEEVEEDIKKSLSSDDQAVELIKSEQYMTAGNSFTLGYNNQMIRQHECKCCGNHFTKALTVCPYCGN